MNDRVRVFVRTCLATVVAVWLPFAGAQAFDVEPGSELLATDAEGRRFVGFGTVNASGVRLELQGPVQKLKIVRIDPDGSSVTYRAEWRDGRLRIGRSEGAEETEAAAVTDLADVLAAAGLGLWISVDGEEARLVPPTDAADPDATDPDATDPNTGDPGATPDDEPRLPLPPAIDPPDAGPILDEPIDDDEEGDAPDGPLPGAPDLP